MVPKSWTSPSVPAPALETRVTGLFCHQPVDATGLLIGTDASGGPNTRDPRLRAVGWSVVLCDLRADRLVELGTISGLLPPGSTVPQGESFAIIQAILSTIGSFDLTSDCKPALRALHSRKLSVKHLPEWGPVWHDRCRVHPTWVRSHCTPEAFEKEFPSQLWRRELNVMADALAGRRAAAACTPHFVRKVREIDQVAREVNCFLASRAEKIIKQKSQGFLPRSARDTLSQFDKPKPHAKALYANKRRHLLQLVDRSEHGHSWKVSSPQGAANLQLTCETCKLWVQQTYSQDDFHKVVTHPCVGFSNEGPTHWPLLHSSHVMRSTGKAWECLGCKQVVGVTSKNLKRALQLPCRSTGRQANLHFGRSSPNITSCPQVRLSAEPPDPPVEAAGSSVGPPGDGQSLPLSRGSRPGPSGAPKAPKPRPRPKVKPKVDPAQRTLRF